MTIRLITSTRIVPLLVAMALSASLLSCTRESELPSAKSFKVNAQCPQTRTYLSEGKHMWVTGDLVRVLSDDQVCVKSSQCTEPSEVLDFSVTGWPSGKTPRYAVYCGQQNVTTEPYALDGKITVRLDEDQKITHKESFAKTANISAGLLESNGKDSYSVQMKNICGLLKFNFAKYDDIKTVVFEDMDSKALAGAVEIAFGDDDCPYVDRVKTSRSSVTVSANGKTGSLGNSDDCELPAGQDYYVCVLPGTYRLKITMTRVGGGTLVLEMANACEVKRSKYCELKDIDINSKTQIQSGAANEDFAEGGGLDPDIWKDKLAAGHHPRLIFSAYDFGILQGLTSGNDAVGQLHDCLMAVADASVNSTETLSYTLDASGKRLLAVSREALARIVSCSYAYRLTGDAGYKDRAVNDIKDVCAFKDWNPSHFLDVAEMATAVSIGYDWLYDVLDEQTKTSVVEALKTKALDMSRSTDNNIVWWYGGGDNWNQVCNGGLVCAAVAVYDMYPELAQAVIDDAVRTNKPAVDRMYAPDGAYPEGPTYWNYGTLYQVLMLTVMEKVFGTDYGISGGSGFLKTGDFKMFARGTANGMHFNYADNTTTCSNNYPMYYFAFKNNAPSMLYNELQLLGSADKYIDTDHRGLIVLALKYAMQMDLGGLTPPSEKFYTARGDVPVMMCRTGWDSKDIYLGVKGGRAGYSHGHMDGGTFVYYADGVRWAKELTRQTYSDVENGLVALGGDLSDRAQSSLRWKLFRLNNRQHNTLTVNDKDHDVTGVVSILSTENTSSRMGATLDLAPLFFGDLVKAERTVAICDNSYLEVKDVLKAPSDRPAHVRWTMVSTGTPEIQADGSGIKVTRHTNSMLLKTTGAPVTYRTWSSNPQDYDSVVKHLEKAESNTWICGYEIDIPAGQEYAIVTTLKKL